MAKGKFDMLFLCAGGVGGGGLRYFPLINQQLLRGGGQRKNPEMIGGGFKKMKGKNKEIIIANPLDKL